MRSILFPTILVLACAGAFLAACDHEEARSTAPESASWNAAFRVDAGSLTARQLESATWVRVEASRDGAVLAAKEAAFDVGSVTLRIPSPGDVDISLTGYRDQTKALVMWRGAGVVKDGLASPALNVVAISAGTGLSYDNTLSSLSVTSGTLVRELPSTATTYFDTVGNSVARVTLSGKTTDPLGTVEYSVDGGDFGTTDSFPLAEGTTTVVTVKSTNLSGSSRTCTVSVYRKPAPTRSKPRYLLSTSATNGTISLDPAGGTYDSGTSVTATATPKDGYAFKGWSGACTNASGTCTIAMTGAKNLTANFATATVAYDSTLSAFTLNGTTVKGFVSGISGAGTRTYDDTVSFGSTTAVLGATATESGSTVSDTGSVALGPSDPTVKTVTVTNGNGNTLVYTIRIHHRPLPRYALATTATNGTISLNPTGGTYDSSASVTATATPDDGYLFSGWSGACTNASGTCTVAMTDAKNLTANFVLKVIAHDSTLSAFTLNGTTVKGFASGVAGAAARTYDDTVSFASTTAILGATATESGSTVSDTGSVALGPTDPTVKTVTVTNANGNTLVYTIRIHHRPLPRYALATTATNGAISLNPTGGTYDSGASVTVTATPDDGYLFSGWSGACGEASATCTVSMTSAKSLTANFKSDFGIPWNGSITYGAVRDSRDQRTYRTVVIGGATWMAENLNYSGSGVCYGSSEDSCSKYGRLYTWAEAMNDSSASAASPSGVKGICPEGWHVPSDAEWQSLEIALGMSTEHAAAKIWRGTTEGTKLKSTGGWNNSGNGTDDYGFRVLPAGTITRGEPAFSGDVGIFWSASDDGSRYGWHRAFQSTFTEVFRDIYPKTEGLSLRCLRD